MKAEGNASGSHARNEGKGVVTDEMLVEVEREARRLLPPDDVHGVGHVERVLHLAREVWRAEGAGDPSSWNLLASMVWLHDVGRGREVGGEGHASASERLAQRLLKRLGWPADLVDQVAGGVRRHSFSDRTFAGGTTSSFEADALSDADKLDATGAIGLYRTCAHQATHGGRLGDVVDHLHEKLLSLGGLLRTRTAKAMARDRLQFLRAWAEQLTRERTYSPKARNTSSK
ncbi:MAG: HD domain-containing protein [Promethearchaeota archaeon]